MSMRRFSRMDVGIILFFTLVLLIGFFVSVFLVDLNRVYFSDLTFKDGTITGVEVTHKGVMILSVKATEHDAIHSFFQEDGRCGELESLSSTTVVGQSVRIYFDQGYGLQFGSGARFWRITRAENSQDLFNYQQFESRAHARNMRKRAFSWILIATGSVGAIVFLSARFVFDRLRRGGQ